MSRINFRQEDFRQATTDVSFLIFRKPDINRITNSVLEYISNRSLLKNIILKRHTFLK